MSNDKDGYRPHEPVFPEFRETDHEALERELVNAKGRIHELESVLKSIKPASHTDNAWFATVDRLIELEFAIRTTVRNAEATCGVYTDIHKKRCAPYTERGKRCPDCPMGYVVEVAEALGEER